MTRRQLAVAVRQLSVVGPISQALCHYPRHQTRSQSPVGFALFDVFRHSTAPSTASFLPSDFWTREFLQLAHSEPAIWHATLALGALHQRRNVRSPGSPGDTTDGLSNQVMENYALAITNGRNLKDPAKLFSLSLALLSVSNMMGRWKDSQVHIGAAHRLLKQTQENSVTKSAAEILTRLDLQAMTFSDSSAPYPFRDAQWLTRTDLDLRKGEKLESYGQAGTALFALSRRMILFDEALMFGTLKENEAGPAMKELLQDLASWELKMGFFEKRHRPSGTWATSIRLYHTMLRMILIGTFFGPETRWDPLLGYFERIIACARHVMAAAHKAEAQSFMSLEPGLIIPLYITVTKCRHSQIRRSAAKLLHQLRKHEGMWSSEGAAAVGDKFIAIEEECLPDEFRQRIDLQGEYSAILEVDEIPWEAWSTAGFKPPTRASWDDVVRIPEINRVREMMMMVNAEGKCIDMTVMMSAGDELGSFGEFRVEHVAF